MAEGDGRNKIRGQTLGDFIIKTAASWPEAAATVYNPGFPAVDDLGTAGFAELLTSRDVPLAPEEASQDLLGIYLLGLNQYAYDLATLNEGRYGMNSPPDGASSPSGLRRGENFVESNTYIEQHPGPEDSVMASNFDTLSGGEPAGTKLGSFFGADRLTDADENPTLLSKLGRPGEPSAGTLLKNRAKEVGALVGEVLDEANLYSPEENSSPYLKIKAGAKKFELDGVGTTDEAYSKGGLWTVQTGQLGDATLGKFDPKAPAMTLGGMRAMALRMMLEASGEYGVDDLLGLDLDAPAQFFAILGISNVAGINVANVFQTGMVNLLEHPRIKNSAIEASTAPGDWFGIDGNFDAFEGDLKGTFGEAINRLARSTGGDDFLKPGSPNDSDFTVSSLGDLGYKTSPANLNSFIEPFASGFPLGMFTTTIMGIVSMTIMLALMEQIISSAKLPFSIADATDPNHPSKWKLGKHESVTRDQGTTTYKFMRNLGLPEMVNPTLTWSDAVFNGMKVFYDFDVDIRELWKPWNIPPMFSKAVTIALSPGYFAVMQRIILRDLKITMVAMADNLVSVAGNLAAAAILSVGGDGKAIKELGVHGMVNIMASSTVFAFMKICATLGNIDEQSQAPGIAGTGTTTISYRDAPLVKVLVPQNRMMISRFHGQNQVRSTLSLHLFNSILLSPSKGYEYPGDMPDLLESSFKEDPLNDMGGGGVRAASLRPVAGARLDPETVRIAEAVLDLEYTPFSIQDLRTNEIISMPAFITSVGEQYSPEYTETHGYGRTDPVRTYAKTTRSVDISFKLAAMNAIDVDYMWVVINKLVTMCYPQYSAGRVRNFAGGTGRFVQPFSQIPTASPVVRLRMGELLHSNFSQKNLERLFGQGGQLDLDVDNSEQDKAYWEKQKKNWLASQARSQVRGAIRKDFFDAAGDVNTEINFIATEGVFLVFPSDPSAASAAAFLSAAAAGQAVVGDKGDFPSSVTLGPATVYYKVLDPEPVEVGATGTDTADGFDFETIKFYKVEIDLVSKGRAKLALGRRPKGMFKNFTRKHEAYIRIDSANAGGDLTFAANEKYIELLIQKEEDLDPEAAKAIKTRQAAFDDAGFFTSEKNAIVRSFKAASGKGLAGVITSMALNYAGAVHGTTPQRKDRVPLSVEVTLGFAPIHDLPVGLDYAGEMTAPVYPVGALNPEHPSYEAGQELDELQEAKVPFVGVSDPPEPPDPPFPANLGL